jgi:hypothetical protein
MTILNDSAAADIVRAAAGNVTTALVCLVFAAAVLGLARLVLVLGLLRLSVRASTSDPDRADQTIRAMEVLARGLEAVSLPRVRRRGPPAP